MNLTVTTFSLFETTKEERVELAKSVLSNIEEGSADPRKVLLQLKSMEDLSVRIKDDPGFRRIVVEESSKFGKSHEFMNSKFEVKEVGTKYDYSNCNDSVYDYLLAQKETIDKKVKERESFLKNIPTEGIDVIDEESGEVSKIYPPSKSSTTSVAVTLK